MKWPLFLMIMVFGTLVSAQNETKRILLLLDGSGSMMDEWKGNTKWELAKNLISQTIDSIQRADPNVEFGLRVFGHQSPRALKDCKDSRLEVPIARGNAGKIISRMEQITPQGHTPIAYSLFLAAGDFSSNGINSIILITDGIENCEGDPCASANALSDKRISLKPFIIGIGLDEADKGMFDCVGTYYDAIDSVQFKNAMDVVVSQALNNTTVQINLLDAFGQPTQTHVELTLYDSFNGSVRYHFVHAVRDNGEPDTLYLDPLGKYDVVAHTTPPVQVKGIELNPGRHNIIGLDAPQGKLVLYEKGRYGFSDKQCIVRDTESGEIVYIQNLNTEHLYISGSYDLEFLTLPVLFYDKYEIKPNTSNKIDIPQEGKLSISTDDNFMVSILMKRNGRMEKIWEANVQNETLDIPILPGDYTVVYRSNTRKLAENTREKEINIRSGRTFALKL